VQEPLKAVDLGDKYDVFVNVKGGGITGQSDAIALGIARYLIELNPNYRDTLKKKGLLKRDPRAKERKKYGQKKARKKFQFSKR
jgi:small subunit ribosomal protein S9